MQCRDLKRMVNMKKNKLMLISVAALMGIAPILGTTTSTTRI
ncbi:hypothetical protein LHEJCM1005_18500 [Lactobacillus helveticus]|nr:hypothetical protein LHEJCM1005_18500 [Lactobacillus helveticus]